MKNCWLITMISVSLLYTLSSEPCQWYQYLGNPGKTAYTTCNGPDSPEILWEIDSGYAGTPFIIGDKVIISCGSSQVGSTGIRIIMIDLLTGRFLEKKVAEISYFGHAYPVNNVVLGVSPLGSLYTIDPVSGEASLRTRTPERFSCGPHYYPIILPDKIVFPTTPVVCLSRADYRTLWDLESSLGSLYPGNGETMNIAASMDRVYVILDEEIGRKIWAVDSNTGKPVWASDAPQASTIAVDESALFVGGDNLYALNAETGKILWEFESDGVLSNIVVGPDAVQFTDNKKLYAVDKNTGTLKWETEWEGMPIWITYMVGAGDTIICSDIFNLSSFSARDGTLLWNVHFQDSVDTDWEKPCPAVADGIIIVRGKESTNNLIALASDPDLFVKQGDAFLEKGESEKALTSYKKAQQLYEKKGRPRTQEIQKKIQELEKSPSTPAQSKLPECLISVEVVLASAMVLAGIFIMFYLIKKRNSK